MTNVLKYDPIKTFQEHREIADAMDNLISYRVETNLEEKLQDLFKQLIIVDDDLMLAQINIEIQNIYKDIEDLKIARDLRIKKGREREIW